MPKGFTVRLDEDQAEELEAVARVDGVPVAEEIRQAIAVRIEQRRSDEEFRARLRQSIADNQKVIPRTDINATSPSPGTKPEIPPDLGPPPHAIPNTPPKPPLGIHRSFSYFVLHFKRGPEMWHSMAMSVDALLLAAVGVRVRVDHQLDRR